MRKYVNTAEIPATTIINLANTDYKIIVARMQRRSVPFDAVISSSAYVRSLQCYGKYFLLYCCPSELYLNVDKGFKRRLKDRVDLSLATPVRAVFNIVNVRCITQRV